MQLNIRWNKIKKIIKTKNRVIKENITVNKAYKKKE